MKLQWTQDMSVGVKLIDDQHKHFIEILNKTFDAFYSMELKDSLPQIIDELLTYAEVHFSTEEKYFEEFNFEFKEEHEQIHRELIAKALEFKNNLAVQGYEIIPDFLTFLEDWLVDHLKTEDRKYVKCFKDHGLV